VTLRFATHLRVAVVATRDGHPKTVILGSAMTRSHGMVTTGKLGDPPFAIASAHYGAVISAVPPFLLNIFLPCDLEGLFTRFFMRYE